MCACVYVCVCVCIVHIYLYLIPYSAHFTSWLFIVLCTHYIEKVNHISSGVWA